MKEPLGESVGGSYPNAEGSVPLTLCRLGQYGVGQRDTT